MAGIDDILKSSQWHQMIQKSLGLTSQLSEIIKGQEQFTKSLSGVSMTTELAERMRRYHRMLDNPIPSAIESMTKGLSLLTNFAILQLTLDSIASINRQHEQLF